ncbi:N-acetyltransferase [Flexivirga endophytica]|uniref:N-acetyltransferase n=1 Tax=Flexivirga endophytica TaxID=1849103 RepID=A0A916TDB1_9MICO|nr:GNAT family protein [Flexivirga endophytica]GGB40029.1 N-acetyltransferase [Flexivirga endophytica]GHB47918.1 N-acetyltransferase [Flexivirga endophytica]
MFAHPLADGVRLRTLEPWHADEFAAHLERAREHIRPWVGPSFVTETVDAAHATLIRYAEATAKDQARPVGIWKDEILVGGMMFAGFDPTGGNAELGCWLEPAAEGHGLITGAGRFLLDWAFGERKLHRVEWRCRADNVRSAAVARRLGMTHEATLRQAWLNGGIHHDKQIWAILAHESRYADVPAQRLS